jgi:cyclase
MSMTMCRGVVVWLLALALLAPGVARAEETNAGRTLEVAAGLYAVIWPESGGNIAFLVTDDGVLVVDSGESPDMGKRVVGAVREKTDKPIRFVVLTHYHDDHTSGLPSFPPSTVVIAARGLADNAAAGREHDMKAYPAHIERLRKNVDELGRTGGADLAAARQRLSEAVSAYETLKQAPTLLPTLEVDSSLVIHLGKDSVEVRRTGNTHTSCSSVVRFVRQKAVHMGDTVFAGAHPFIDAQAGASTARWLAFLAEAQTWDVEHVIPGHGPLGGKEELTAQTAYLEELRREVAAAVAGGLSADDAVKTVAMSSYSGYRFEDMLPYGVRAVYQELKGGQPGR